MIKLRRPLAGIEKGCRKTGVRFWNQYDLSTDAYQISKQVCRLNIASPGLDARDMTRKGKRKVGLYAR